MPASVTDAIGLTQPKPPKPPALPDPKTEMGALETRIEALVEAERLKINPNAKPLAIDPELGTVARARASDMAAKNYFAHTAPDGETSASLLMAADATFQGLLGENMAAQHYTAQSGIDVDAFAQRFVDTWLASAPHKENLAFPNYNRTGVGAAVNGDTIYVTQLFATDLGMGPRNQNDPATATPFPNPAAAAAPAKKPAVSLRGPIAPSR